MPEIQEKKHDDDKREEKKENDPSHGNLGNQSGIDPNQRAATENTNRANDDRAVNLGNELQNQLDTMPNLDTDGPSGSTNIPILHPKDSAFENDKNQLPKEKIKVQPPVKDFKTNTKLTQEADEILKKVGAVAVKQGDFAAVTGEQMKGVSVITDRQLIQIMKEYPNSYAVLDLRDPTARKPPVPGEEAPAEEMPEGSRDMYDYKIKGAYNFPLSEDAVFDRVKFQPQYANKNNVWIQAAALPHSPLPIVSEKAIVVVHCRQSVNRTPQFVSGYVENMAGVKGQRVVILSRGFEFYDGELEARSDQELAEAKELMKALKELK
ncbi:hypothetical protein B0T17DRAFT_508034 [Bombardia bombarda]|uniref:Rhodanese domain-containing protein n=1 Tax=Bombardia bombarda TaxID=252184 RepID=A0AA40C4S3_9PEZI|nr:hypothetical protein B0T17DRAFT_508034 [Bombardia bombarda]